MRKLAMIGLWIAMFSLGLFVGPSVWNSVHAGNGSSGSKGKGNNENPPPDPPPPGEGETFTQYTQDPYENEIKVDFDGNPSNISGKDHEMQAPYAEIPDQPNLPAVGVAQVTGAHIDGPGGPTGTVGVVAQDTHDDISQVEGGIINNVDPERFKIIEKFVQSAKMSADVTIDTTSTGQMVEKNQNFGTEANPVVVYAAPSDTGNEKNLHFAGQNKGYGVLVIEVNDPKKGGLKINAKFKWIGVVIVVVNYRDTNNNNNGNAVPLTMNGAGQNSDGHVLGGSIVYHRNQVHPTEGTGSVLDRTLANVSGGGSIHFSADAVNNVKVKGAVQVRSWRKRTE